jgi:hypothetical protein
VLFGVGAGLSHGRFPLTSRSHARAVDPLFSSAASLARAALIWSRIDISGVAAGGVAGCAATGGKKRVIVPIRRYVLIARDSTSEEAGAIYFVGNLGVGAKQQLRIARGQHVGAIDRAPAECDEARRGEVAGEPKSHWPERTSATSECFGRAGFIRPDGG